MSAISQDTYAVQGVPLTGVGGGGSFNSTFSSIYVADEVIATTLASALTSTMILEAEEGFISSLSSFFVNAVDIGCSSISTLGIVLDGNILTSASNELLLNGIPIATNSSLSSIADWAIDPAISTLQMNNNPIIDSTGYRGTGTVSTADIQAGSGFISTLVCSDISTITLTVQSTIHTVSTISSLVVAANAVLASSINGAQFPGPNSDASQWANFPAVSTITGGMGATNDLRIATGRNLGIEARVSTGIVIDRGIDVGGFASFNVLAKNGNRGQINLTADPGFAGIFGEVNITANGGTTPGLIASGGLIALTANTPVGALPTATSAIKLSAAGVNSYAGAIPPIGSLLGYNFIYGTLGVNLCAGIPPLLPNTPGTTYLYGTSGITLGSQTNTASDITQSSGGGLYTTLVTGYWPGGIFGPSNLLIRGRQVITGNSYVQLSNVDYISFDSGASRAITGVSTINGAAYPPPGTSIPANLTVSSLTAQNSVGTAALTVSSINGGSYPPPPPPVVIPSDLVVSTLTAANYVSTSVLNVSSVNGYSVTTPVVSTLTASTISADRFSGNVLAPSILTSNLTIPGDANVGIVLGRSVVNGNLSLPIIANGGGQIQYLRLEVIDANSSAFTPTYYSSIGSDPSTIGNFAAGRYFIGNGGGYAYITTSTDASTIFMTGTLNVSSLQGVSTINGAAYPPAASVPANLAVSTLTVAGSGSITLEEDPGTTSSAPIFLKTGNETIADGVLQITKSVIYTDPSTRNYTGLTVGAFSTLGSLQPVICASVLLNPTPNEFTGAPITGDTSGNVIFPMSTIVGISTINGAAYPPAASVSPDLVVSSLTAAVNVITFGLNADIINGNSANAPIISSLTSQSVSTSALFVSSVNGAAYPPPGSMSADPVVSTLTAAFYLSTPELYVSSVNGAAYPPTTGGIQSTIANSGSFIDIDGSGHISSFSGGATTLTASSGGIYLLDSDNNASIRVASDIVMSTTIGGAVRIDQGDLYVSTIYLSSINGAAYPPPAPGGSPNAEFSTLTVSSFASVPEITNVSSINNVNFNGGDIGAQNVSAETGFNLAGAGTFTINGSTGAERQVIQIIDGYPEWATPVMPAVYYSSMAVTLPVFSTFSTVISRDFTTQTSTGNCLVTGNVTFQTIGSGVNDNLTTNMFFVGSGLGTAISTTSLQANAYQNISLQYVIPQANLNAVGSTNTFEISIKKPNTNHDYQVTYATISVTTDLN